MEQRISADTGQQLMGQLSQPSPFEVENSPAMLGTTAKAHELSVLLPVLNEHKRVAAPGEKPGENFHSTIQGYLRRLQTEFGQNEQGRSFTLAIVDDGSFDEDSEHSKIVKEYGVDVLSFHSQALGVSYRPDRTSRSAPDNGVNPSKDTNGTVAIAKQHNLDVFHSDEQGRNLGRGKAYKVGFLTLAESSKVIGAYDGDGSYPAETLIEHYNKIRDGHDMVVSYRPDIEGQHANELRAIAHKIMHAVCEPLAPTGIVSDPQAGAFAMTSDAAKFIFDRRMKPRWAANRQIYHLAHLAGMSVAQIESEIVTKGDSRMGGATLGLVQAAVRMLFDSADIGLRYHRTDMSNEWAEAQTA